MSDDGYFGAAVARDYDQFDGATDPAEIAQVVEVLHDLAGDGTALEFAIGTGRIALPLAARGCTVKGIELSQAMVAELRAKESGPPMDIAVGDMTTTRVAGDFSLVFLVYNTIDNLVSQEAQVACFSNAAAHLPSGGRFLVETLVPPLQRLPVGETRLAFACSADHMGIDEFDVVTQTYTSHHVWVGRGQDRVSSVPFRYAWPAEMDLMARLAGMSLEHRWGGWDRGPFTRTSRAHVSVWKKD